MIYYIICLSHVYKSHTENRQQHRHGIQLLSVMKKLPPGDKVCFRNIMSLSNLTELSENKYFKFLPTVSSNVVWQVAVTQRHLRWKALHTGSITRLLKVNWLTVCLWYHLLRILKKLTLKVSRLKTSGKQAVNGSDADSERDWFEGIFLCFATWPYCGFW